MREIHLLRGVSRAHWCFAVIVRDQACQMFGVARARSGHTPQSQALKVRVSTCTRQASHDLCAHLFFAPNGALHFRCAALVGACASPRRHQFDLSASGRSLLCKRDMISMLSSRARDVLQQAISGRQFGWGDTPIGSCLLPAAAILGPARFTDMGRRRETGGQ